MDWEKFWLTWGPPAPFLVILVKMLYDLLYKIVPDGFATLKKQIEDDDAHGRDRHAEHMEALYELIERIDARSSGPSAAAAKKRRRRYVRQTGHEPPAQ